MADYVYVENYSNIGKMGISHTVFDQIAAYATARVKGASVVLQTNNGSKKSARAFKLNHPAKCEIKNGIVDIEIDVMISARANVNDVCLKIQEEVASAISSMTEMIPFNINIKVAGISA